LSRMPEPNATALTGDAKKQRSQRYALVIVVFLAALTAIELLMQQLNKPVPIVNNLLVWTLLNLNIILLLVLIVVVVRNLAKLYIDRKNNILGAKFQTRLIVSFIILSSIPTLLLSLVASNLLRQSLEGWFNVQIEHSLRESLEVAQTFYNHSIKNALYFAEQISEILTDKRLLREEDTLREFLRRKQQDFNFGVIEVYSKDGIRLARLINPKVPLGDFHVALAEIVQVGRTGQQQSVTNSLSEGDLIKSIVPILSKWEEKQIIGVLVVDYFVDGSLASKMKRIRSAFEEYKQLKIHQVPILGSYLLTFLLITLLVFFSAIWLGMHLAKAMTIPIQQLAAGTKAVAEGNLAHKVTVAANDEVGLLVDSFNQMTSTLKAMTDTLTERRRYIETVLENIATGVVSISPRGIVTTFNRAAARILDMPQADALHQHYRRFFETPDMKRVFSLIRAMYAQGEERYEEQFQLSLKEKTLSLVVNVTTMHDDQNNYMGTLIVFDDLTQLLRAQRIAAWREVARRLAHEIKNPLTPIQLSAERLRRQAAKKSPRYEEIFEEATQTIIAEVGHLRHLVDEFSRFARMPAVVKAPVNIHELLKTTLSSYAQYYQQVRFRARFTRELTVIPLDARQMKQVIVNLLDNAIQAMQEVGEIRIQTFYDAQRKVLTMRVEDSGPGITDELKERLFIPYFSTKGSGRGLGLAIVQKIIAEHGGTITVADNVPRGTVFVLELPAPSIAVGRDVPGRHSSQPQGVA